jgi:hypothetical protein
MIFVFDPGIVDSLYDPYSVPEAPVLVMEDFEIFIVPTDEHMVAQSTDLVLPPAATDADILISPPELKKNLLASADAKVTVTIWSFEPFHPAALVSVVLAAVAVIDAALAVNLFVEIKLAAV